MAKKEATYTLKIDAELSSLQNTLNTAKKSLDSFMSSGNAPKGLEKAFEKINNLLGQMSDKAGKSMDLRGLAASEKDLQTIQENFKAIIRLLGDFENLSDDLKISFLTPEEQKKFKDATAALENYDKAAEEASKKIKLLEDAKKANAKNQQSLGKAQKKVNDLSDEKTRISAKLSGS